MLDLGLLDLGVQKSCGCCQQALILVAHDVANVRGQARAKRRILQDLELLVLQALIERSHGVSIKSLHALVDA